MSLGTLMDSREHFALLARYNQWMNDKLLAAAAALSPAALAADRGAFFGSVQGTVNHLLVADTIWLKRLRGHPVRPDVLAVLDATELPRRLDQPLFESWQALAARRRELDQLLIDWVAALGPADLAQWLEYHDTRGQPHRKPLAGVLVHVFNHQTHHRGQITTLLSQAGVDIGVTDLLVLLPDAG